MTNIRIPLKTKVKAIQNKTQKKEDIEIPNNIGLKVQLNKTSKDKFIDENLELKNRILFLEESIQNAREETFLSGIEEGKEQLRHEMESVLAEELEALKKATKTILSEFEKEIKNLNQPILTLSKEIARRIIDSELQFEEKYNEVLLSQIERILHEMIDEEIITIYVAPQQIEWIKKSDIEKHLNVPDKIKLKFFTDKSLVPGECVLESSNLLIEGKFETQLEQIENQLTNL